MFPVGWNRCATDGTIPIKIIKFFILFFFLRLFPSQAFHFLSPFPRPHASQFPPFIPFPWTGRTLHCVLTNTVQVLFKIQWYRILNNPAFLSFLHPSVWVIDPSASRIFSLPWHLCWNGPSHSITETGIFVFVGEKLRRMRSNGRKKCTIKNLFSFSFFQIMLALTKE